MSQVKTAISIDEAILRTVNLLAKKAQISRSRFFELAVREWVRKNRAEELTRRINRALDGYRASADDVHQANFWRNHQRKLMEGKW